MTKLINKPEEHKLQHEVYRSRTEPGVMAMRGWLQLQLDAVNKAWPTAAAEDVCRLQGQAQAITNALKIIEVQPINPE